MTTNTGPVRWNRRPDPELIRSLATVMSDPSRVCVLTTLSTADDPLPFDDLVEAVTDTDLPFASNDRPSSIDDVSVVLHHWHLPALDEHGFITYDEETGIAALTERGAHCLSILGVHPANGHR